MKTIVVLTTCLMVSATAVIPTAIAQDDSVFSGPQVGEQLSPFQVKQVLGEAAGKEVDPVKIADGGPIVLVFVHERTRPAFGLTNAVMRMVASRAKDKLTGATVFLSADPTATESWMNNVQQHFATGVIQGISPDGQEGPGAYGLNRNVALTVLVGNDNKVTANFALVQPSLQVDGPRIAKAIVDVLGGGDVPDLARFSNQAMNRRMDQRTAEPQRKSMSAGTMTLLRAVINKQSSDEDIERAAKQLEELIANDEAARMDIGQRAHSIVVSGKIENYGTKKSQDVLQRWATTYGPRAAAEIAWNKHTVFTGEPCMSAVADDYTDDGIIDVIADTGGGTLRLFAGPDWKETVLDADHGGLYIHSETWDIDGDGDADYVGARYNPGLIMWYEQPDNPLTDKWTRRLIDDQVHGIHGVIKGDVDADGRLDLLATSAQPKLPYPDSLAWFSPPQDIKSAERWHRHIFADRDAPGLTHYLGFGDINGDGRPDAATGAKGGPTDASGKGERFTWWAAGDNPEDIWTKNVLPGTHPGATNIHPADINGDGVADLLASRGHGVGVLWFEAPDWDIHMIDEEIKEPHCLVVQDLDGDDDIDAVTCAYGSEQCVWYENDGTGQFTRHLVGDNQQAYDIRAVDMDSDGDLDFLVAGRASNNVVWYENPSK